MKDAIVIGTGPYGLVAAATLARAGLDVALVGREVFETWKRCMPEGMVLRTDHRTSTLYHPASGYAFADFARETGEEAIDGAPLRLDAMVRYGEWYAARACPLPIEGEVSRLDPFDGGFRAQTALGGGDAADEVLARRAVVATGLGSRGHVPEVFARGLPPSLYTHTSRVSRYGGHFEGRDVAVIGGGQSAVEAVLGLSRAGAASITLIHREAEIPIEAITKDKAEWQLRLAARLSRLWAYAPRRLRDRRRARVHRPSAEPAIAPCLEHARRIRSAEVARAEPRGDRARLTLTSGGEVAADHVVLATGYEAPLAPLRFLDPLRERIAARNGFFDLDPRFESTIPGLHFVGSLAEPSHGPAHRFLFGTRVMGPALAAALRRP